MVQDIIKEIENLSGNYSGYEIFNDWVKATAISISNGIDKASGRTNETWRRREDEYMAIAKKHGVDRMQRFSKMTMLLALALENNLEDVLGRVYMEAGLGSKQTGQFFTPFHISEMMAKLTIPLTGEKITLNEPSCGGGGMLIAGAKRLKDGGLNFQKLLDVTANDLDWKGVYMTYVQLSLLGIRATVWQGDTLSDSKPSAEQIYYTPAKRGILVGI